uniref:polysaccharide biosynthesis/export family protein n=1 Tax=Chitinilyticum piscinae TaxID=2866724 RepID=UPI003570B3FE
MASGDRIILRMWGAFDLDTELIVDPQGNVFLPHVGPVRLQGVRNQDLQKSINTAIAKVFRANVYNYASLAMGQPVKVYVSGFVNMPGMYEGTSTDSLLQYLDRAGGIDPERGSFLDVQIKRGNQTRASINLYDFLTKGNMPQVQLADGDVIFVAPRHNVVTVKGLASNPKQFEFTSNTIELATLGQLAKPLPHATNIRITRNTGNKQNTEYHTIANANQLIVQSGDEVEYTADKKPGTITVRIEGEHLSAQEYVLPYGAKVGDLLGKVEYTPNSDSASVQLFRNSVKDRQKAMLDVALKSLEATVLTARSGSVNEAKIRSDESTKILNWIDRARQLEPTGQVFIAQSSRKNDLLLENGDIIRIPVKDGLVLVGGEVLFPNSIAYDENLRVEDYISAAGGFTQDADSSRIVVAHANGSFSSEKNLKKISEGDRIMVLPKVDTKFMQFSMDISQIVYQIAVAVGVVLDFKN